MNSDRRMLGVRYHKSFTIPKARKILITADIWYFLFVQYVLEMGAYQCFGRSCCLGFQFSPTEMLAKIEKQCRKTCGNMIK